MKNYFSTNKDAEEYFLKNVDYDLFFNNLDKVSIIYLD
jgi:hypothetical protein